MTGEPHLNVNNSRRCYFEAGRNVRQTLMLEISEPYHSSQLPGDFVNQTGETVSGIVRFMIEPVTLLVIGPV